MKITRSTTIDEPWIGIDPVRIGSESPGLGTPDMYIIVTPDDDDPLIRIDVYGYHGEETFTFSDAVEWGELIVIGYGHRLYMVNLHNRSSSALELQGYFGSFTIEGDCLIAASASNLYCFAHNGSLLWVSDELGIDGVVVTNVDKYTITGEGEWDPPGGWRPFTINANDGKLVRAISDQSLKTDFE